MAKESSLQRLRQEAGYSSARSFAEELEIPASTYSRYEQAADGSEGVIPLKSAWLIADMLGCTIDEVVGHPTPAEKALPPRLISLWAQLSEEGRVLAVELAETVATSEARTLRGADGALLANARELALCYESSYIRQLEVHGDQEMISEAGTPRFAGELREYLYTRAEERALVDARRAAEDVDRLVASGESFWLCDGDGTRFEVASEDERYAEVAERQRSRAFKEGLRASRRRYLDMCAQIADAYEEMAQAGELAQPAGKRSDLMGDVRIMGVMPL